MFEKEKETQSEVMEGLMNPSLCSSMNAEFDIVKPESEVPKSKVPKSRPKGLGMTQ